MAHIITPVRSDETFSPRELIDTVSLMLAASDRTGLRDVRPALEQRAATAWQDRAPDAFQLTSLLGDLLLHIGAMNEAHMVYQRALDIARNRKVPADARVVASVLYCVARIALTMGDRDVGLAYGAQALLVAEEHEGKDHHFVRALRHWLLRVIARREHDLL